MQSASAGASGAERARMDDPGNHSGPRDLLERIVLSAVGAVALTADRADALAEGLAERGLAKREDARAMIEDFTAAWGADAARLGERAGAAAEAILRELGLVTRDDFEELELRLAQLEHRLSLLEPPAARDSTPPVQH
jgi:polyhydroxyalkanoate synthesis regulator phasin